jgi:hypothetical protein
LGLILFRSDFHHIPHCSQLYVNGPKCKITTPVRRANNRFLFTYLTLTCVSFPCMS